jgi:hypothetical protein
MDTKLTEESIVSVGLSCAGFEQHRASKWTKQSRVDKLKCFYGSCPIVVFKIWNNLQAAAGNSAFLTAGKADFTTLLMALWFLKRYPTCKAYYYNHNSLSHFLLKLHRHTK